MTIAGSMNYSLLLQRKKTLLLTGIIVALLAFGISKILPFQYAGEGGMVVETPTMAAGAAADEGTSVVQTQIDVLMSKGLLTRVVHELNLSQEEIAPSMRLPKPVLDAMSAAVQEVKDYIRSMSDDGRPQPPPNPLDQTIDYVQKHLLVTAKAGSKLINLRFLGGSPQAAALVVNGIMNSYMTTDSRVQDDRVAKVNDYVAQQTLLMQADIKTAQDRLSEFVRLHNVPEVNGGTSAALLLSRDEEALAIAKQQLALRQAALDTAQSSGISSAEETLESQTIQALKNYEAQIIQQMGTLTSIDPRRQPLQAGLSSIQAQLAKETGLILISLKRNVTIAQAKVSSLEMAVQAEMARTQDASNSAVTLKSLTAELDLKRQALLAFSTQAGTMRSGAEQSPSAHVLFEAVPPARPVNTFVMISIVLGFVGGVAMSGATIMLRDAFNTKISTTYALELQTQLPSFGSLPAMKRLSDGSMVASKKPQASVVTESFRSLWIRMQSEQKGRGSTALVTSSEVGEGKTTTATAIAQQFQRDGFRVLLVDADLRRPRLAGMLRARPAHYLENVMDEKSAITLADAVYREPKFGFDCLMSNGRCRNPARMLTSEAFKAMVEKARGEYDFVVMDSPPVMHVVDPVLLASVSDFILFVVKADTIHGDVIAEATRRFSNDDRTRMFTLLTQVKPGNLDKRDYFSGYDPTNQPFDHEQIEHDA